MQPEAHPISYRDRPVLPALTSIRFFAAIQVVMSHYLLPVVALPPVWLVSLVETGQPAVTLFFVLSGFVLAYSHTGPDGTLRTTRRSFWLSRFARIYPIYLVAAVLTTPTVLPFLRDDPGTLLVNGVLAAALLQSWLPHLDVLWNSPGWSVSVEAFFYLVFPWICGPLLRTSIRRTFVLLALCYALTVIPRALYAFWYYPAALTPIGDSGDDLVRFWTFWPLLRLPDFITGILVARLVGERAADPSRRFTGVVPTVSVLVTICAILVLHLVGMPGSMRFLVTWLMLPLLALLVGLLAVTDTVVGRVLGQPLPVLLGNASYAIYILQVPVYALERYVLSLVTGVSRYEISAMPPYFVLYVLTLILVSIASFQWFERPIRRIIELGVKPNPRVLASRIRA